jgi:hypothetical protein
MRRLTSLLMAVPVAAGLLAAPAAYADNWNHGGGGYHGGGPRPGYGPGYHGGGYPPGYRGGYHGGYNNGPAVAGAVVGLGAAAILGGVIASQAYRPPPPVVYAAPPGYYAPPPGYYAAPPPTYYAAPPGYYPQPY